MANLEKFNLQLVDNFEKVSKLFDYISTKKIVAYDTESNSISPWFDGAKLLGISLCYSNSTAFYIPLYTPKVEYLEDPISFKLGSEEGITGDDYISRLESPFFSEEEIEKILKMYVEFLQNPDILKIAFNLSHEIGWVKRITGEEIGLGQTFDPMLGFHCAHMGEQYPKSLKKITDEELPEDFTNYEEPLEDYKTSFCKKFKIKKNDFCYDTIPIEIFYPYAAMDALATYRLYFICLAQLQARDLEDVYWKRLQEPSELVATQMECTGLQIDIDYFNKLEEEIYSEISIVYDKLLTSPEVKKATTFVRKAAAKAKNKKFMTQWQRRRNELKTKKIIQPENFTKRDQTCLTTVEDKIANKRSTPEEFEDLEFNFGSNLHLAILLNKVLKLGLTKKTPKGNLQVDEDVLKEFRDNPIVAQLLELKALTKLYSTYIVGIRKFIYKGRLHGNYNFHIAKSGRLSSSKPNHQNFPNTDQFNRMIVAREGYSLVYTDASNVEARLMAILSDDENLCEIFKVAGGDMHAATAKAAFNLPESVEEVSRLAHADEHGEYNKIRQTCKTVNFLAIYGGTEKALSKLLTDLSMDECIQYIEGFHAAYPKVQEFFDNTFKEIRKNWCVECVSGRKRYINRMKMSNSYDREKMYNSMVNTKVQGPASDLMLEKALMMDHAWRFQPEVCTLVRAVHDSMMWEVKDEYVEEFLESAKPIFSHWPSWIPNDRDVKFESEFKTGKVFSEMEKC